jgi:hypothetical protein
MARWKFEQLLGGSEVRGRFLIVAILVTGFGWLIVRMAIVLTEPSGTDPSNSWIRHSADLAVVFWFFGPMLAIACRSPIEKMTRVADVRLAYTAGCLIGIEHVALAFHLGHGWSHQAAFEHTERASGFGAGLYVNYLFLLLWVADVSWSWLSLDSYLHRPGWLKGLVMGFMGFIIFNAAVVFGNGPIRWTSLFFMVMLCFQVWGNRRAENRFKKAQPPA